MEALRLKNEMSHRIPFRLQIVRLDIHISRINYSLILTTQREEFIYCAIICYHHVCMYHQFLSRVQPVQQVAVSTSARFALVVTP